MIFLNCSQCGRVWVGLGSYYFCPRCGRCVFVEKGATR